MVFHIFDALTRVTVSNAHNVSAADAFTWLRPAYGLVLLTLAHGFDAHVCLRCASHLSERIGSLEFLLSSSLDVKSEDGREAFKIKEVILLQKLCILNQS